MVATFISLCTYTKFTEARLQPEGRLELNTNSTVYTTKDPYHLIIRAV
jgi:hypothetical protein